MGINRRTYELYEEDLIEMFKLCPDEDVEKIEVWYDTFNKRWSIDAIITEKQSEEGE